MGIQQGAGSVRQSCCGCKADGHGWVQRTARHSSNSIATACHARTDGQAKEHGGTIFLLSILAVNCCAQDGEAQDKGEDHLCGECLRTARLTAGLNLAPDTSPRA